MLSMDMAPLLAFTSDELAQAVRLFQLGHLQYALDDIARSGMKTGQDETRDLLASHLRRGLRLKSDAKPPTLIWQVNPKSWEGDWLIYLLSGLFSDQICDLEHSHIAPKMLVIDNAIDSQKSQYYRRAYDAGSDVVLIHLSDEAYKDDYNAYRWCSLVYRNYWSPLLNTHSSIKSFPLGTKIGFLIDQKIRPASTRNAIWGFAGDCKKSSRKDMIRAMSEVPGGRTHLTASFGSHDALSVAGYQALLGDCIFAPCPSGYQNLDSFRVYEALECGAIPIVERRSHFDYFTEAYGPHPMPTVTSWTEAPEIIQAMQAQARINSVQDDCTHWWSMMKLNIRNQMKCDIATQFGL